MAALRRTHTGEFALADAVTPDALEQMTDAERLALLRPVESLFADLAPVNLPAFYERLCRNGAEIYQKKIGTDYDVGRYVRLYSKEGFFALGRVYDFDGGSAIKSEKIFRL